MGRTEQAARIAGFFPTRFRRLLALWVATAAFSSAPFGLAGCADPGGSTVPDTFSDQLDSADNGSDAAVPSCDDGLLNGDESGVDCGGTCEACAVGDNCRSGSDCETRSCVSGTCQPASCDDGIQNGDETDEDCGGSCAACGPGAGCAGHADCASGFCAPTASLCADPACGDGLQNGDETDIDCGGNCPGCLPSQRCQTHDDCASLQCDAGLCAAVACGDGIVNGGESCDPGNGSAPVETETCDLDCTEVSCGDGHTNTAGGEACDDGGDSMACDSDCTAAQCGDGYANSAAGESCDDAGESAACDPDCTSATCGDGYVNAAAAESCDDAGESTTCDADCTAVSCGDGVRNSAAGEACDTAGDSATCDVDCTSASCGDGHVNAAAGENCDGGGATATCDSDCTQPVCGDGVLNTAAGEACDDGNTLDGDGCSRLCTLDDDKDGVPNADDPYPSDPNLPGVAAANVVYAHTATNLFTMHPFSYAITGIGAFSFDQSPGSVTDIALDRWGVLYAVTFDDLFVCNPNTAACRYLGDLPSSFNGLTMVPPGTLDPADDTLLGIANDGNWYRITVQNQLAQLQLIGAYGGGMTSAGDVFSIEGTGTFGAVNKPGVTTGNVIVESDPTTGVVLREVATANGYTTIYGLAGWDNKIFAFNAGGQVVEVDPLTGATQEVATTANAWWGAGVYTVLR